MEKPSKLKVVFDRKVLNKYQILEGLKRSWVLLKPNIKTISDLQSHVQKSFCLDKKCPNGVVLYIDGFVLPPFESTCMLHESDIISVRKKDNTQIDSIEVGDKPLAITEAGENSNGQKQKTGKVLCMHNENGVHTDSRLNSKKKRKHSDEIPSPEKKKLKGNSKKPIAQEEDEDIVEKVAGYQSRKKNSNCSNEDDKFTCSLQRVKQYKTVVNDVVGGSAHDHANGSVAKKQSRNARRKKEKRIWLRELKAQNRQNDNQQFGINNKLLKQQEAKQNIEIEKDTAPPAPSDGQWLTLEKQATNNWNRPANTKKQNYGSVNQRNQSNAPSNHQYCNRYQKSRSKWRDHTNNISQNYARNNSNKGNNANGHNGQKRNWSNQNYKELCNGTTNKWNNVNNKEQCSENTSKWDDASINYEQSNRKEIVPLNEKKGIRPIDFESLFPLTRIPQVRDLIAYRLIEMSSSWCPYITPFRIGEVTSYNYLTLEIVLVPVPEYPFFTDDTQQKSSQYKEDGTLQIHYPSLIDVRLFKAFDSLETSSESFGSPKRGKNPQKAKTAPVNKWELALANGGSNVKEIATRPIENGNGSGGSTWDQIKHIINEKRSEIDQNKKDGWGEWTSNKSTSSNSWKNGCSAWNTSSWNPQQAARGRGMGPTRGSFRGGRGKGNYNKPSFGK